MVGIILTIHLILSGTLGGRYSCYPHFTDEGTEAPSYQVEELGFVLGHSGCRSRALDSYPVLTPTSPCSQDWH